MDNKVGEDNTRYGCRDGVVLAAFAVMFAAAAYLLFCVVGWIVLSW